MINSLYIEDLMSLPLTYINKVYCVVVFHNKVNLGEVEVFKDCDTDMEYISVNDTVVYLNTLKEVEEIECIIFSKEEDSEVFKGGVMDLIDFVSIYTRGIYDLKTALDYIESKKHLVIESIKEV